MKSSQLAKLKTKWYKKLKDSGFEDIEDSYGGLKYYESQKVHGRYKKYSLYNKSKEMYYQQASIFLSSFNFTSTREKSIFEKHVNGESYRKIGKQFRIHKDRVMGIIRKYQKEMKLVR